MGNWSRITSALRETARENGWKLTLFDLELILEASRLRADEMAELMDICECEGIKIVDDVDKPKYKEIPVDPEFFGSIEDPDADPADIIIENERRRSIYGDDY